MYRWIFLLTFALFNSESMNTEYANFPRQMLPFSKKTKKWRKACVLWANNKTFFNYSLVRKSVVHKQINYNLLRGKINM